MSNQILDAIVQSDCSRHLQCGTRLLKLNPPAIMGILNITPDSFYDGGRLFGRQEVDLSSVLSQAEVMIEQGAGVLDVGGESTRPGAARVTRQQELDRVIPVVEALVSSFDAIISVDTSDAEVMKAAAVEGAGLINDVRALRRPGALQAAAATGLPVCLMHMQGEPDTMQLKPEYDLVCGEVLRFLEHRIACCEAAGIGRDRIVIDPGFGFGKSLVHNLALFAHLELFVQSTCPVLVGVSRKSMIGTVTGRPVQGRLAGGLALATMAALEGVALIRTHDVAETRDAIRMVGAVLGSK